MTSRYSILIPTFAAAAFLAGNAFAGVLTFSPVAQLVAPGGSASVDVVMTGLGSTAIGDYDLTVNFDPSLVLPTIVFGAFLGGPINSVQSSTSSAGMIEIAEISFLDPVSLAQLQQGSFTIATLTFTGMMTSTGLSFSNVLVDDALGSPVTLTTGTGSITVVPEPADFSLILLGVSMLAWIKARSRRRS